MKILKTIIGSFQLLLSLIATVFLIFIFYMIFRANQDNARIAWSILIIVVLTVIIGIIFCLLNGIRLVTKSKNLFSGNKWLGPISYVYIVLFTIFFLSAAINTDLSAERPKSPAPNPLVGKISPDINATDISGNTIILSGFRGKYVLLDFWASWCGPCKAEIPNIQSINELYSKDKLVVIGISIDKDKQSLLSFLKKNNISFKQIYDKDKTIAEVYNVNYIPMSFLINPDGIIIAADVKGQSLRKLISNHIK
jgi:peroxiredoxin